MEKVDFDTYARRNHILHYILVEMVAAYNNEKFTNSINPCEMEIEFKLNGVELSFVSCMEGLQTHLDAMENTIKKAGVEKYKAELIEKLVAFLDLE